jgi:hypothetical protein
MERPADSCVKILERLTPVLPAVLNAYRVPEPRARELGGKSRLVREDDSARLADAAPRGRAQLAAA